MVLLICKMYIACSPSSCLWAYYNITFVGGWKYTPARFKRSTTSKSTTCETSWIWEKKAPKTSQNGEFYFERIQAVTLNESQVITLNGITLPWSKPNHRNLRFLSWTLFKRQDFSWRWSKPVFHFFCANMHQHAQNAQKSGKLLLTTVTKSLGV